MDHESKMLVVCMAEDMPSRDEASSSDGIVFSAGSSSLSAHTSYEDVLRYKGLSVSKYHNNAGIGYWGTYVN